MRRRAMLAAALVALSAASLGAPAAGTPPSGEADGPLAAGPPPTPLFPRPPVFDNHVYHHYPDMTTELQELASQYPDTSKLTSIGRSVDGRELWQMEITDFDVPDGNKSTIYIDGGHHGNEQLGMEMALQLVHEALYGSLSSPEVLRSFHFFIVPMINPDGNMDDSRTNSHGVDLNRNYGFMWTDEGNHGSGPESEPEARNNAENMRAVDELYGLDLYLSGHTGTNILIYSWAWSNDPAPDDGLLYRIGSEAHNQTGVTFGQTSHELYIATGSSKDLAYGELGAPGFTYEVDDQQNRLGTYTTTIAERLSDEIRTCVLVILNTPRYRADLGVARVSTPSSGGTQLLSFTVENRGWGPALNATASLSLAGGRVIGGPSIFSVAAENSTNLVFEVEGGGAQEATLTLTYDELQVNSTDTVTRIFVQRVDLPGGGLAALAAAGGGAFILLAVAAVALVVVDRRSGGAVRRRAGPAFQALRRRLPGRGRGLRPADAVDD